MGKVAVIGGGAAGMMAAVSAAKSGHFVVVFEKNEKLGKKIYITGKGRCNFTNASSLEVFRENIISNPKFLYSALQAFDNTAMMRFVEEQGVPVKVERGNRVFPVSDHASDITKALEKALRKQRVKILLNTEVEALLTEPLRAAQTEGKAQIGNDQHCEPEACGKRGNGPGRKKSLRTEFLSKIRGIRLKNGTEEVFDAVIIATGGLSYPTTGSTGDGYRFATESGHRMTAVRPALVPLLTREAYIPQMQGLSLRNVSLTIKKNKKILFREFGELLFTDRGISGPLALSASSRIGSELEEGELRAMICLKPALTEEQLKNRLERELTGNENKTFYHAVAAMLPKSMNAVLPELLPIPLEKRVNQITKGEKAAYLELLQAFPMTITGTGSFKEAIVTQGGVNVKDVNPSSMESKITRGLYFAGEVLDVDGLTGGYNLQIAFSTGFLAGESITESDSI